MKSDPFKILVCLVFIFYASQVFADGDGTLLDVRVNNQTNLLPRYPQDYVTIKSDSGSGGPKLRPAVAEAGQPQFKKAGYYPDRAIYKVKPKPCYPKACGPVAPCCYLPRRLPGQWEAAAQLIFSRFKGSVRWYDPSLGGAAIDDVDFNDDLGLPAHVNLPEYTGRYQFRRNWAFHYSLMIFKTSDTRPVERSFNFGMWNFPSLTQVAPQFKFYYQRVGMIYHAINTPRSIVSVFNYWLYNDQSLEVRSNICGGVGNKLDRTRFMAMSGVELQKCIVTKPNRATLSCDSRVGVGYLDDTFALDLQVGLQYSVWLNSNRWGYAKGGWRYLDIQEDRDDLRLDMTIHGGFIEAGFIF
jgi:hypothetical protein